MTTSLNISDIFSHDQNFQTIMKNMLQTTFDVSFDGVMITEAGPGYPIIYVNPAFCHITGYTVEELLGKSPSLLQGDQSDQNVLAELKEKIEKGHTFHGKTVNYKKDGSAFTMEWKIVPIRNAEYAISHYLAIQRQVHDDELTYKPHDSQIPFSQE
jgi:PAS domain S-box-containing protein